MATEKPFANFKEDFPAVDWFSITPADGTNIQRNGSDIIPRSVWVGGAGDLVITSVNGSEVTLTNIPAGTLIPIQPEQIQSTNTTATNIIGLI